MAITEHFHGQSYNKLLLFFFNKVGMENRFKPTFLGSLYFDKFLLITAVNKVLTIAKINK